jgi:hypothetical protein
MIVQIPFAQWAGLKGHSGTSGRRRMVFDQSMIRSLASHWSNMEAGDFLDALPP